DPSILEDLGLMPMFSVNGSEPASFSPRSTSRNGLGVSFGFGGNEEVGNDPQRDFVQFRADPLSTVFGGSFSKQRELDNRFTDGAGDSKYGFRSAFAIGPGFGQAGYGDLGGPGFGSGQGVSGDPGFKDPSRFSFAGVAQQPAAFNKFKKPKPDQSSFGVGAGIGAGTSGLSGGSSVTIGGKP